MIIQLEYYQVEMQVNSSQMQNKSSSHHQNISGRDDSYHSGDPVIGGLQNQTISSPHRQDGALFDISASPYGLRNTGSKRTSDLYNVDVAREGYQELDPLVPHHSSINQRQRQNDPEAHLVYSPSRFLSNNAAQTFTAKTVKGKQSKDLAFGQGPRSHVAHQTIDSEQKSGKNRSRDESQNATASFLVQDSMLLSQTDRNQHQNKSEPASFSTFSPQKMPKYPENKSLSPLTGQARYPKLIPMQSSVAHNRLHNHQGSLGSYQVEGQRQPAESPSFLNAQTEESKLVINNRAHTQNAVPEKRQSVVSKKGSKAAKQHQYFIDTKDIVKMLTGAAHILESTNLDALGNSTSQAQGRSSPMLDSQYSSAILEVAGGDYEAAAMLKLIEEKTALTMQQYLQTFRADYRSYQTEDSSLITSIFFDNAKEMICGSLLAMKDQIDVYVTNQFKGKQGTARLGLSVEKELYNICRNMFGPDIFGQSGHNSSTEWSTKFKTMPRRIMNELWQAIQLFRHVPSSQNKDQTTIQQPQQLVQKQISQVYTTYPADMMTAFLTCKLLMHCRGKALFCSKYKAFTLHRAVFEGNLPLISRLVSCRQDGTLFVDKNEIDPCGNSPLVLAIRLKNIDIVKILTDLYCSAKLNPFPQVLSAMDIAKTMKDRKIVEILMNSVQKVKQHYLEMHKEAIFKVLERLPDFSIDLHFECTSNYIPLMKHFTPSDVYHIYKQGSNLRLDMHFLGYQKLKSIEGSISVLFKGRGSSENEGELLLVDHESGRVASIFETASSAKIERQLDNIMSDQDIQKKYRAEKVNIELECDRKGAVVTQKIEEFTVQKYTVNSVYTMTKFKLNLKHVEMLTKYKTFEDYLKHMKIDVYSLNNPCYTPSFSEMKKQSSFAKMDHYGESNVSSRPFAKTTKVNQLLQDIQKEKDQSKHLHTHSDTGLDKSHHRESSVNACKIHSRVLGNTEQLFNADRALVCTCDKSISDNANFGLTPIITKSTRRTLNASIWLCKEHPLSIETFLPLLQVLSFSSKQIRKLEQAIDRYNLPKDRFPLKAKVPVFMLVEATFQFGNLQFGQQPDSVFLIDQQVLERQRENLKQHYYLMQDQSKKSLNCQTDEETRRQNQTLSALYRQLSLPESNESNSRESSLSDEIEDRYKRMLTESQQDLQEESKTQIVNKDDTPENKMTFERFANETDSIKSSGERHTPANEYDIAVDSASNPSRGGQTGTFRSGNHNQLPTVASSVQLDVDQQNVKTARQISTVKTMSQINERHEQRHQPLSSAQAYGVNQETYDQLSRRQEKLDENKQLIERLTGKPLNTQEQQKHSEQSSQADQKLLYSDKLSMQTVQERKKRRKELIRLYKLRKTEKLDKNKSRANADMSLKQIVAEHSSSENIMDSRIVDQRPIVNETVEKRKLAIYNDSNIAPNKASQLKLNIGESSSKQDDQDANANLGSKRSSRVTQPPFSILKKEAGSSIGSADGKSVLFPTTGAVGKQAGQSTADESSESNSKSQKSLKSLKATKSQAINKSSSSLVGQSDFMQSSIGSQAQSFMASLFQQPSQPKASQPKAISRRYQDKNHLQTIESEEVQGTEGTVVIDKKIPISDISQNPYQSNQTLKSLENVLKNKRHPMHMQRNLSRQTQELEQNEIKRRDLIANSADMSFATKPPITASLSQILRPSVPQFALTNEEKETLANPNMTLNRLHQYVVNNKDIIQNQVQLSSQSKEIQTRKKQRGHTSYVHQSKYQDAGIISFEALLGSSIGNTQKQQRKSSKQQRESNNLHVIKEEKSASTLLSMTQSQNQRDASGKGTGTLMGLLTQKQGNLPGGGATQPIVANQRPTAGMMIPTGKRKAVTDVDIKL